MPHYLYDIREQDFISDCNKMSGVSNKEWPLYLVEGTIHHPEVGETGEGPQSLHLLPAGHGRVWEVEFPQRDLLAGPSAELADGAVRQREDLQPGAVEEDGS